MLITLLVLALEPAALPALHARAAELEQTAGATAAVEAYLSLLDGAITGGSDAGVLAALDALVTRPVEGLEALGRPQGLAYRSAAAPILARLERAYAGANALGRMAVARAAHERVLYDGDAAAAARWGERRGCVREAAVVGPLAWPPLPAVSRATPLERTDEALAASYPGVAPFARTVPVRTVPADGCDLDLHTTSTQDGLRALVVDVEVPRAQRLELELESRSMAALVVGGRPILTRGYELGPDPVRVRGWADVAAGQVRVVVRVGLSGEASRLRLAILDARGNPLAVRAPHPGDRATGAATAGGATSPASADRSLRAAALLALGDERTAEHVLEEDGEPSQTLPSLLYARALAAARDRPETRAVEGARQAYAAVLRAWPRSWEALAGQAATAVKQHGAVPGQYEALALLRLTDPDPALLALQAVLASRAQMRDSAEAAYSALALKAAGTPLLARVDRAIHERVGAELESFSCQNGDRDGFACYNARVARGDRRGALAELARLRILRRSPEALWRQELEQRLGLGQRKEALAVYERMLPAQRPLAALGGLLDGKALGPRLLREIASAPDAPGAAAALLTNGQGATPRDAETARRIADDRRDRNTAGAATLVLVHRESYTLSASGLLRYDLYDVRRVSGTSDVSVPAQAAQPVINGRTLQRTLRRRIFKPDGRILDPEQSISNAQGHTDLSQLEPGDYLEEVAEGWALPLAWGQVNVATPDLFPLRTSVADATIEIRHPAGVPLALWAHPRLGKAVVTKSGGDQVSTFTVHDAEPRRTESGVHWTERSAGVFFGTARWEQIAAGLAQTMASLADDDGYVSRWASNAARGSARDSRDLLDRLATAVGQAVKRAHPLTLVDWAAFTPAPATSARHILELGEGSRTWVAYRALRELGVRADIVVAEATPFSADPNYPPRAGRFSEPLLVAHLPSGDVWMQLDVKGPPLTPGQLSPELRGRQALTADGPLVPVPDEATENQVHEVNVTLRLDAQGTARGTVALALRGEDAQILTDELDLLVGLRRDQRLRSVVLGWFPSATVNLVSVVADAPAGQLAIRADVELPGYAQAEAGGWALPGLEPVHRLSESPRTLGSAFARVRARESPLTVEDALQFRMRRRVTLPAKASLVGSAPALVVRDANLEAFRGVTLSGEVVDERYELSVPTAVIEPERYERFVKTLTQVDDVFQSATRVNVRRAALTRP